MERKWTLEWHDRLSLKLSLFLWKPAQWHRYDVFNLIHFFHHFWSFSTVEKWEKQYTRHCVFNLSKWTEGVLNNASTSLKFSKWQKCFDNYHNLLWRSRGRHAGSVRPRARHQENDKLPLREDTFLSHSDKHVLLMFLLSVNTRSHQQSAQTVSAPTVWMNRHTHTHGHTHSRWTLQSDKNSSIMIAIHT